MKNKGFTLIEMLVVLAIISIVSVAAVNGYSSYRKSALLDFAADNLVSEFNQMRSKTIYQDNNAEKLEQLRGELGESTTVTTAETIKTSNLCYGISLKQDGDFYSINNFSQPFNGTKQWSVEKNAWIYSGCADSTDKTSLPFEYDPAIKISSVETENGVKQNDLVVNFLPPNGELQVSENLESVLIKMQYGEEENQSLEKVVRIDFKNAIAEVL